MKKLTEQRIHNLLLEYNRERLQFSTAYVSERLGISETEYQAIEAGFGVINDDEALRLARLFSIPYQYIIQSCKLLNEIVRYKGLQRHC